MNKRSDFADEWFNEDNNEIYQEKIEYLKNDLILKWIKVNKNEMKYHEGDYVTLSFESMSDAKQRNYISSVLVEIFVKWILLSSIKSSNISKDSAIGTGDSLYS